MKKLIVLFAFFSVFSGSAQNNFILKQPSVTAIPHRSSIDAMPNALVVKTFDGTKIGNNGQGSDLYRTEPDNMIVAKPDSCFYDNIPNATGKINPGPGNLELLRRLYEEKKDSVFTFKIKRGFTLLKPNSSLPLSDSIRVTVHLLPSLPR